MSTKSLTVCRACGRPTLGATCPRCGTALSGPDAQAGNKFRAWLDESAGTARAERPASRLSQAQSTRRRAGTDPAPPPRRAVAPEPKKRTVSKAVWIPLALIAVALLGLLLTPHRKSDQSITLTTPAANMPWRLVFSTTNRFAVELPGPPKFALINAADGTTGESVTSNIPGVRIDVSAYPYPAGTDQSIAITNIIDARSSATNVKTTSPQQVAERWGVATQVYLSDTHRIGVLTAGFVNTTMYVFQVMGAVDDQRTRDVVDHLVTSLAAAG